MDTSTLASSASNQNIGLSVMKKAIKLQEDQMQSLLQGAATSNSQESSSSPISAASTHTGVGAKLNILG